MTLNCIKAKNYKDTVGVTVGVVIKTSLTSHFRQNKKQGEKLNQSIVDGKKYVYKNVILAATMNGKYYGGDTKNAPDQDYLMN